MPEFVQRGNPVRSLLQQRVDRDRGGFQRQAATQSGKRLFGSSQSTLRKRGEHRGDLR